VDRKLTHLTASMNWIGSFVIGEVSNPGFARLGYRFYIIFAAFNLSFIPIGTPP